MNLSCNSIHSRDSFFPFSLQVLPSSVSRLPSLYPTHPTYEILVHCHLLYSSMSDRAAAVRKRFPRFRILIIGRANAGKTTLLQRVCKTTESPIVRDRRGTKVTAGASLSTDRCMLTDQPDRRRCEGDCEGECSQIIVHSIPDVKL